MLKANSDDPALSPIPDSSEGEASRKRSALLMVDGEPAGDDLLRVVNASCEWLYPYAHNRMTKRSIILRTFAWLWFFRPEWLGNPTQVKLSKRLKVSKQSFNRVVNQLRNKFHFHIAGMRGDDARAKFAANAKRHARTLAQKRRAALAARGGRHMRKSWLIAPTKAPPGKESI